MDPNNDVILAIPVLAVMCIGLIACGVMLWGIIGFINGRLQNVSNQKQRAIQSDVELNQIINSLPPEKQMGFLIEYNSRKKNPTTAILLALLLGGIGAHKFYLGEMTAGFLYLIFTWTYIPLILGLIEAFTISNKVKAMNGEIARQTLAVFYAGIEQPLPPPRQNFARIEQPLLSSPQHFTLSSLNLEVKNYLMQGYKIVSENQAEHTVVMVNPNSNERVLIGIDERTKRVKVMPC